MCDPNMLQLLITNYQCRFTVFLTYDGKFVGIYPWTSSDQNLVPCGAQDAPGSHWSPNCFPAAATSALHLLLPCSTKTRFRRLAFTTQTTLCSGVWDLTVYKPLQQHLLHRPLQGCKNIHIFNLHCIPNVRLNPHCFAWSFTLTGSSVRRKASVLCITWGFFNICEKSSVWDWFIVLYFIDDIICQGHINAFCCANL